jgi:tRNA-dihydrouridine synthase A
VDGALGHLAEVDGIMLGRAAYQNPWILAELGRRLDQPVAASRYEVVEMMAAYAATHMAQGGRLQQIARHMLGLFHRQPGARRWRQLLSQNMHRAEVGPELLLEACPDLESSTAAAG